jgi:hypothetical protein
MEFKPTFSKIVRDSFFKVDWQKVIARVAMTEGPLTSSTNGTHDLITTWRGVKIMLSMNFVRSLSREGKDWSLDRILVGEPTTPLAEAAAKAIHVVDVIWRALVILFPRIGECMNIERSLQATLVKYTCLSYDGDLFKFLKFHTCAFFSITEKDEYGLPQEMPEPFGSDKAGSLFVGVLQDFLKQKATNQKAPRQAKTLRFTILQGIKKGFPLMDAEAVIKTFESGAKDLCSVKVVQHDLLAEIKRTAAEVCPLGLDDGFLTNSDPLESLSTHACLEAGRFRGGALGAVRESFGDSTLHAWDSFLARLSYHPKLGTWEDRIPMWGPAEEGLAGFRREALQRILNSTPAPLLTGESVVAKRPQKQEALTRAQLDELTVFRLGGEEKVCFQGILEPLKVRPITVSSFETNHLWQPLQKQMWRSLQNFPIFRLTGRPVDTSDIQEIYDRSREMCSRLKSDEYFGTYAFNSADYRSATNVLAMSASLAAVEGLCPNPVLKRIMYRGLCGNALTYRDENREEIFLGTQTNGQLMGSVFSFPLLCIVNAAVVRASLERAYNCKLSLKDLPILINGDDMLGMFPPSAFNDWREMTSQVGLEPSVGKNYYSPNFAMINSRIFDLEDGVMVRRPYVNFSFITGVRKMGGQCFEQEEISDDTCLKAVAAFEQSADEHSLLPLPVQRRVEEAVWEYRSKLWYALGLSTGPSGFNLRFHPDIVEDNRLDYILARLRLGPFKGKLQIPAHTYEKGSDFRGAWRYHSSLCRTGDTWEECRFFRRLLGERKVCNKYKSLLRETGRLTRGQRTVRVLGVRLQSKLTTGRRSFYENHRARSKIFKSDLTGQPSPLDTLPWLWVFVERMRELERNFELHRPRDRRMTSDVYPIGAWCRSHHSLGSGC